MNLIRITLSKTIKGKNTFNQKKIVLTEKQWNDVQSLVECFKLFAWTARTKDTTGDVTVELIRRKEPRAKV